MILTILVGNTNTRLTFFHGRMLKRRRIVPTGRFLSCPEDFFRPDKRMLGAAFASVVPGAMNICRRAIRAQTGRPLFCFNKKIRTGLDIHYNLDQLGPDRICAAVGGHVSFPGNIIVLDFGTAVTVNAVTKDGRFLGGAILPGLSLMLTSLNQATARLPRTRPGKETRIIQHGTRSAMRAGTFHLFLGGLDHIIQHIESETHRSYSVIATGGGATLISGQLERIIAVDQDMAAKGLVELFYINQR